MHNLIKGDSTINGGSLMEQQNSKARGATNKEQIEPLNMKSIFDLNHGGLEEENTFVVGDFHLISLSDDN